MNAQHPTPIGESLDMTPNVQVRPNVLCMKAYSADGRTALWDFSIESIPDRLFYWELLELSRRLRSLIPSERCLGDNLTHKQRAERDAFMRVGLAGGSLWPAGMTRFKPLIPRQGISPFFESPRPDTPAASTRPITPSTLVPLPARPSAVPVRKSIEVAKPSPPVVATQPVSLEPETVRPPVKPVAARIAPTAVEPPSVGIDEPQTGVITASIESRLLVLAPPGTGKTHTLIERVAHLIRSGAAPSARAIVVLSFTRAAVAEIVTRIGDAVQEGAADNLRFVTVRTFDSFATQMLMRDVAHGRLPQEYDDRIRTFALKLKAKQLPEAEREIGQIRCLIVDEVQDLGGPRAQMVLELMAKVLGQGGGVVLLGDPAQAIYDWQRKNTQELKSHDFLANARRLLGANMREVELKRDYRSTNEEVRRFAREARQAMGKDGATADGIHLGRLLRLLGSPLGLQSLATQTVTGRVAVLTRKNVQAFQVVEWCRQQKVPCSLSRGSSGHHCPGWLARLTHGFRMERMSMEAAEARWRVLIRDNSAQTFLDAMTFLRTAGVATDTYIDLLALSRRVMQRHPKLVVASVAGEGLIVSTIHKSKGLQFEEVYLLEPDHWEGNAEEVRVVYVAATRARTRLRVVQNDKKALGSSYRPRWKIKTEHLHRFDGNTGVNSLFLDGLEEIDTDSLLELANSRDVMQMKHDAIWDTLAGSVMDLSATFTPEGLLLTLPSRSGGGNPGIQICRLATVLEQDLGQLYRAVGLRAAGLTNVQVVTLASVAFPLDDDEATALLGTARLALVPVIQGWATVVSR